MHHRRPVVRVHVASPATPAFGDLPSVPISFWRSVYDKEIGALAIPALFSVLLDPLLSLVDTAIVGRLGVAALGAVGLATLVFNFSAFLFSFLMVVTVPRVASANANNNPAEASRATAQGLQVSLTLGTVAAVVLWYFAPSLVAAMSKNGSKEVTEYAVSYLRCRCVASPAVLSFFVALGSFRGFRDTVTPLYAAIAANVINLVLDLVLIFVFNMGVAGAAIATSVSQYVSCTVLVLMLIRRKMLRPADLLAKPPKEELFNFLKAGVSLSSRNILSMVVILYATTAVSNLGAASLAAHEILRQVWVFAIQGFSALDIATQALIAVYVGQGMQHKASSILKRTLQLGTGVGAVIAVILLVGSRALPCTFTSDAAVINIASSVLPFIAFFLPFDAVAAIMDGSLLGAGDTGYLGRTMLVTASISMGVLYCARMRPDFNLVGVWMAIKLLTLGRVAFGAWRLSGKNSPLGRKREVVGEVK